MEGIYRFYCSLNLSYHRTYFHQNCVVDASYDIFALDELECWKRLTFFELVWVFEAGKILILIIQNKEYDLDYPDA